MADPQNKPENKADEPRAQRSTPSERDKQRLMEEAFEREQAAAVVNDPESRSAAIQRRKGLGPTGLPLVWVISNRVDNRVIEGVGWHKDPAHPGGEAFLGGPSPSLVARTGLIEGLLNRGLLLEVPEPSEFELHPESGKPIRDEYDRPIRNRKFPAVETHDVSFEALDQPGRPIRLGRELDRDLWRDEDLEDVEKRQARSPRELPAPSGAVVPAGATTGG